MLRFAKQNVRGEEGQIKRAFCMQPVGTVTVNATGPIDQRGAQGLFTDKRRAERLPLACPIAYRIEAPRRPLEGATKTIDLSSAGVQILIDDMVSPQTPCRLTITLPEHSEPLTFNGRIAWCRISHKKHGKYETGVEFSRPSSYTDPTFALLCRFIATRLIKKNLSG